MQDKIVKYKINQGDIIKFGRITIRIKEINKNKNLNLNKSIDFSQKNNKVDSLNDKINLEENLSNNENDNLKKNPLTFSTEIKKKKVLTLSNNNSQKKLMNEPEQINVFQSTQKYFRNKLPKICRICYVEEDPIENLDNPLIQPCKCTGSLKYIHLNCLKQWLNTKSCIKVEKNDKFSMFIVKEVECELCKTVFPDYVRHKDKLYEILDFKSEFENYLTIESLTIDKNGNRCIYVIDLDNNEKIKIGRGHGAEITLSDISVSRIHSILTIENKNIYIEDNNSKFGTLILVQSPSLKLIENLPLYIQIGRTFMDCRLKKISSNLFSCCEINEKPNENYYFDQNEKQKQDNLKRSLFTIKSEIFTDEYENDIKEKDNLKTNLLNGEDEIGTENPKNNRYNENTLDYDNTQKEENDIKINLCLKKSLFNNEVNRRNNIYLNNEENREDKNLINNEENKSDIHYNLDINKEINKSSNNNNLNKIKSKSVVNLDQKQEENISNNIKFIENKEEKSNNINKSGNIPLGNVNNDKHIIKIDDIENYSEKSS